MNEPASLSLCVTVHQIGDATWPKIKKLIAAIDEVEHFPLTLLVVPNYHGAGGIGHRAFENALSARLVHGDELSLHGFSHFDEQPIQGIRARITRSWYARSEAEFSALTTAAARQKLRAGCRWFYNNGWPIGGFVAPAELLSEGSWNALRVSPFEYTATRNHLHDLQRGERVFCPSIVYGEIGARVANFTKTLNGALAMAMATQPLVRFALHPNAALETKERLAWQHQLGELLAYRRPVTQRDWICSRRAVTTADEYPLGTLTNGGTKQKSVRVQFD